MLLDPGGFRWLNETWLKVDRGVSFYNTSAIPLDAGFLVSRLVFSRAGAGRRGSEPEALRARRCAGSPRACRRDTVHCRLEPERRQSPDG